MVPIIYVHNDELGAGTLGGTLGGRRLLTSPLHGTILGTLECTNRKVTLAKGHPCGEPMLYMGGLLSWQFAILANNC